MVHLRGRLTAVEVTSSSRPDARKLAKLRAAAHEIGADQAVLVHGGGSAAWVEGVHLLPLHQLLLAPHILAGEDAL